MMNMASEYRKIGVAQCVGYPHPYGSEPELPFEVLVLNPRPASREVMLAKLSSASSVYGVEVTIPEFAELCAVNLDHHGPEDSIDTPAACEQALTSVLPERGALVVTVRPDSDAVIAMAVLALRLEGRFEEISPRLVKLVSQFDRFGPFVPDDNRDELTKSVDRDYLSALGSVASANELSFAYRVRWAIDWINCQADDGCIYRLAIKKEAEMEEARQASEVSVIEGVALVVSKHRFATALGYEKADIVVAFNPEMAVNFKDPEAGTYKKFTVAKRDRYVPLDMKGVLQELNVLEDTSDGLKWGGQENIIGSPQGRDSSLTAAEVINVVKRHID